MNTITASVGEGGMNRKQDVGIVQHMLNVSGARTGVPKRNLKVDGIVGPKTIAAIREYQARFCSVVDGKVDPGRETMARLNQTGHTLRANDGVSYLMPPRMPIRFA